MPLNVIACEYDLMDIKHSIIQKIIEIEELSTNIHLIIHKPTKNIVVNSDICSDYTINNLNINNNTIKCTLEINNNQQEYSIIGKFYELIKVPVIIKRITTSNLITNENITEIEISSNKINRNTIIDIKELINTKPKYNIDPMKPILKYQVEYPTIIERNVIVDVIYKNNNVVIRTKALTLEKGKKGDVIKLKNINSQKEIQGIVHNKNTVYVIP